MASSDFASLTAPLSPDEPCGPDLDLAGDPDFSNFLARSEGIFPTSFLTRNDEGRLQTFDRTAIDFPAEFKSLDKFLGETRDLRLLTIYGRLLALNRDLPGFAACISSVDALLRERWDDVNPKGEDGDYALRGAVLQGLDDNPTVIMPLQHLPLVQSRRSGPISYRSILVASGEASPRDEEPVLERSAIDRAFAEEVELDELKALSERLKSIVGAANSIQAGTIEKAGYEQAVQFDKLPPLVGKIQAFVDGAIAARDPTAAQPAAAGATTSSGGAATVQVSIPAGRVATLSDATEALAAVGKYFRRHEPSSPAALLVAQAQALVGKSFSEVVRILVPYIAENAKIQIGADKLFGLTFDQLSPVSDATEEPVEEPEVEADDAGSGYETAGEEEAAGEPDAAGVGDDAAEPEATGDGSSGAAANAAPQAAAATRLPIVVKSRPEASALLDQIGAFFRLAEPSSPVPLLTDRARSMIDRDFLALLKDVLPEIVPGPP